MPAVTANETASKASLAELLRSVGGPQLVEQARDCEHKSRDHPVIANSKGRSGEKAPRLPLHLRFPFVDNPTQSGNHFTPAWQEQTRPSHPLMQCRASPWNSTDQLNLLRLAETKKRTGPLSPWIQPYRRSRPSIPCAAGPSSLIAAKLHVDLWRRLATATLQPQARPHATPRRRGRGAMAIFRGRGPSQSCG